MARRTWIVVALGACVVAAIVLAATFLVQSIPGVARLVHREPAVSAPQATLRPTFTPRLPTASWTPSPPPTGVPLATWTPDATAVPIATLTSVPPTVPIASLTAEPAASPTPEPPTALPPAPTRQPQWIAFETKRGDYGDYEVYVMTTEGSRLTNISRSWADDLAPVWSPDGRHIAFVSLRDSLAGKWNLGSSAIYIADFDPDTGVGGNEVVRLTEMEGNNGWPTWSPNGRRVAFESERSGNWDIWVINVDGTGLVNLTNSPEDERYPAWSPDGKKMAFTSKRTGNYDVYVLDVQQALGGTAQAVNLTQNPARDRYAMWSPDGTKIAFNTGRDGNQEIYVMGADGSNPTNVSNSPKSIEGLADWSPNGQRMVLYSTRPGNKDVFLLDLATGRWTNLTNNPASDEFSTWSPSQ